MRVSKYLATTFILLAACSQKGSETALSPEESATFIVSPVEGSVADGSVNAAFANVATSRIVNFKACLKDVAVQEAVRGAEFTVRDGDKVLTLKSAATDEAGCLYWTEEFPFQSTSQENFLDVSRTIEAVTVHKGRATVKLSVNPWRKGKDGVMDLRFTSAPRQATVKTDSKVSGLSVESVATELEIVRAKKNSAEANLRLTFSPKIYRLALDGSPVPEALTGGKFAVTAQVFALSGDQSIPFTSAAKFEGKVVNGVVQMTTKVEILRKVPRESQMELSFEAVPLEAPEDFGTVRGRVPLGRFTSLSIKASAQLRPETNPFFNSLTGMDKGERDRIAAEAKENTFGFELERLNATKVVVGSLDATGKPNSLLIDFSICPRNAFTQEKILDKEFSVALDGKIFKNQKTDPVGGCLKWFRQPFKFNYHAKEVLLPSSVKVTSQNEFYGDSSVEHKVHLNLWNYKNPAEIVTDEFYDGRPLPSIADQGTGSEIVFDNSWFNYMGRTFEIDNHLNLSTTRTYRFQMTPKIRRMSRSQGWLNPEGTGNGRYFVKVLLETVDKDAPEVIDAQTLQIDSYADSMSSTVNFHINDLRYVNLRTNVSVQVLPLDGNRAVVSRPHIGTFDMLGGFTVRMEPRKGTIDERMKLVSHKNRALRRTGLQIFRDSRKPTWLSTEKMMSMGVFPGEFDSLVAKQDKEALGKLCKEFFDANGWFSGHDRCVKNPQDWLAVVPMEFLRDIKQAKPAGQPDSIDLDMSAGVGFSESESEDVSGGTSWSGGVDAKAGIGIPLGKALGIDIGFGVGGSKSWNYSSGWSKGKSQVKSRGGGEGKKVTADKVDFLIKGLVDHCVLITERTDKPAANPKVLMGCHSHPQLKTFTESYYFLYQNFSNSALMDVGANLDDRPLLALIRGKERYENFRKLMQDPEFTLNLKADLPAPADVMREAENRYDGFFPGLLSK